MSWSSYWLERARTAARRQKRIHGLETSGPLTRLLAQEEPRLGPADSLRVIAFVYFGSPRARLRLYWHHVADRDTPARIRKIESLARDMSARLSGRCRVTTGSFERQCFSRDLARVPRILEKLLYRTKPFLVVQPRHEEDVLTALAFARERRIPVYPRGVSSSAFGGAIPTRNGLVLDFSSMTEILSIDPCGLIARVQPGVRWADLASRLERHGLACITTPSSRFSTVGGWASTGGLGIDGFGHGHFSRAIAGARIALADGGMLALTDEDPGLQDFLGTEGQLGIFTELALRVRLKPAFSSPRLAYFDDPRAAFAFVDRLTSRALRPVHVAFFDRERMVEENSLFRNRTGRDQTILEERDAVLLHYEDADPDWGLAGSAEFAHGPGARYLWMERFFPLKAQRLGPGLLAAEVVLPKESVTDFIDRARRLAGRFGIKPAFEAIISRLPGRTDCVVIATFPCDPTMGWNYLLRMILVQMLVHQGVRCGGHPYGLGIWNTPFLAASYSAADRHRLARRKQELDPRQLLNPNKFFGIRTRFFNLPGLLFRPAAFAAALALARVLSPLLGALAQLGEPVRVPRWRVPSTEKQEGAGLLLQAVLRCTSCGSCVSACPAYLLTGEELVAGRSKLRMAEAWLAGEEIGADEAHRVFQCLRCGLCEEVCQTRLPLRDCYLALENLIEKRHGHPSELVRAFVQRVDANRGLIHVTFGLDLPEWYPNGDAPGPGGVRSSVEADA